ncbi:unnamed protein product, partial [Pleuronectes platessa]
EESVEIEHEERGGGEGVLAREAEREDEEERKERMKGKPMDTPGDAQRDQCARVAVRPSGGWLRALSGLIVTSREAASCGPLGFSCLSRTLAPKVNPLRAPPPPSLLHSSSSSTSSPSRSPQSSCSQGSPQTALFTQTRSRPLTIGNRATPGPQRWLWACNRERSEPGETPEAKERTVESVDKEKFNVFVCGVFHPSFVHPRSCPLSLIHEEEGEEVEGEWRRRRRRARAAKIQKHWRIHLN